MVKANRNVIDGKNHLGRGSTGRKRPQYRERPLAPISTVGGLEARPLKEGFNGKTDDIVRGNEERK